MTNARQKLGMIFELGYSLAKVDHLSGRQSNQLYLGLKELNHLLKKHFPTLEAFQRGLKPFEDEIGRLRTDEVAQPDFLERLRRMSTALMNYIQANYADTILLPLASNKIIGELQLFYATTNDDELFEMAKEAVLCLEAEAYRAAVLLVWSLTFEFLRKWIFNGKRKRLQPFNAALVPLGHRTSVAEYGDFDKIPESTVIQAAYNAKLFRKHQYTTLKTSLDERNQFAHPTGKAGSQEGAYGYIHNLMLNVLKHKHFQKRPKKA